ncbi:MAG TPA: tetratricopeptide repeat protein [Planctomycetaceae bacterium]
MRQINARVVRKLTAADGYLELGMPAQALAELETVSGAGPLQPAVEFMTGLALKDSHRYEDAIEPLQKAAIEIPAPHNRDAWLSLGVCYRMSGLPELAVIAEMFADEPGVPEGWDDGWPDADTAHEQAHAAALAAELKTYAARQVSLDADPDDDRF